jgi:hypothetical protein
VTYFNTFYLECRSLAKQQEVILLYSLLPTVF